MRIMTKKKLGIMKRYLGRSVLIGSVAAMLSTLWIALWDTIYGAGWINESIILEFWPYWILEFLLFCLIWSLVMSVVVPAISCDEFTT